MKKNWKIVCLVVLCIMLLPANSFANNHESDSNINVDIDWASKVSETTPFSFGTNGFKAFDPNVAGNEMYNQNVEYMNPGFFRYHASESMRDYTEHDRGWIDNANETWAEDRIHAALSNFEGGNPIKLLNIYGWPKWMETYDVLDNNGKVAATLLHPDEYENFAAFCAELVQIVNIKYGHDVKYWEITNERDVIYYVNLKNKGLDDRLDELITMYNMAAKAMKEVDPTINTGGLGFARGDLYDQVRRFVQGTIQETSPTTLDFLSYHFYANGDQTDTDDYVYSRVHDPNDPDRGTLATHTADIRQIVDEESLGRKIPIYLNEFNISWTWTNNDPRMHNHKGAVYDALSMIYAHDNGADGTNSWNEMDDVYGKMDNNYILRPGAHLSQLLNNYMIGNRVSTSTDTDAAVVPFATVDKESGAKSFMLINRTSEVQSVHVDQSGWSVEAGSLKLHQISEHGYTISAISVDEVIEGNLVLPANSVTLITDSETNPTLLPDALPVLVPQTSEQPGDSDGADGSTEPILTGYVDGADTSNLTEDGSVDWVYWGHEGADNVNRKEGTPVISNLSTVGPMELFELSSKDYGNTLSWTDGVNGSVSGTKSIAVIKGDKNTQNGNRPIGFEFTVPAGTDMRSLKIYAGAKGARGQLEASLSDGSTPVYKTGGDSAPDAIESKSWITNKAITLNYRAASENETLTIKYTLAWDHWGDESIWLQAAALSQPDTTPPTQPAPVSVIDVSASTAAIRWGESTDNVGVTGYRIYNGDQQIASTEEATSYFLKGLIPEEDYQLTVEAIDQTGNHSVRSEVIHIHTESDTTSPVSPAGLMAVDEGAAIHLSWSDSFDDVGVVAYEVLRQGHGEQIILVEDTQYVDEVAADWPYYTYTVTALDQAGNRSSASDKISVVRSIDINGLEMMTTSFIESGDLSGPIVPQLKNSLEQMKHHMDKDKVDQAIKHLEDFIKHLNNSAMSKNITDSSLEQLNGMAEELLKQLLN